MFDIVIIIALAAIYYVVLDMRREAKRTNDLLTQANQTARLALDNLEMICHDAQFRTNRELGR